MVGITWEHFAAESSVTSAWRRRPESFLDAD